MIKNAIETGKLVKDIASADNAVLNSGNIAGTITDGFSIWFCESASKLAAILNAQLPPKNGNGFLLLTKNK